ncbi:hypothetical protein [Sphingobacterium hungaricum]
MKILFIVALCICILNISYAQVYDLSSGIHKTDLKDQVTSNSMDSLLIAMEKPYENSLAYLNLSEMNVFDYIEKLKLSDTSSYRNMINIYKKAPKDWITLSDIDSLVLLIDSEVPAKCTMLTISSLMPTKGDSSTIGGQVMNIIQSYREKTPYPNQLTNCAKTDAVRAQEIKDWWSNLKTNSN